MSMIHKPLMAAFFALLALCQAALAVALALAFIEMVVDAERFEHAEASIGIALAGAVAFTVTTIFSVRAAQSMWAKWKTGRQQGGPLQTPSEQDQTE